MKTLDIGEFGKLLIICHKHVDYIIYELVDMISPGNTPRCYSVQQEIWQNEKVTNPHFICLDKLNVDKMLQLNRHNTVNNLVLEVIIQWA